MPLIHPQAPPKGRSGPLALPRTPIPGWRAWGVAGDELRVFTGGVWADLEPDFDNLEGLGVNAVYDGTNRVSVAADATLLNHDGAGHQLKLNKSGASETASLLFQTGFSGRAEMGLAGTDDFAVKVSADGSTWFTPLVITAGTGKVTVSDALNIAPGSAPAGPVAVRRRSCGVLMGPSGRICSRGGGSRPTLRLIAPAEGASPRLAPPLGYFKIKEILG